MIGDVPKGAPLKCRLGRHKGQSDGGTMCFTCPNCGGSFWQKRDYSAVTAQADRLIEAGRADDAEKLVREALRDA
jgi:uncharacterized C2H2 Zn-finger protein